MIALRRLAILALLPFLVGIAAAEDGVRQSLAQEKRELAALRTKENAGIVGIVAGGVDGTDLRTVSDLAAALDDDDLHLRVFPMVGKGSLQNLWDIVFTRGVDVGIVQSDVLEYAKRDEVFPEVERRVQYIARLYDEEVHILARSNIKSLADLEYKKVNFDNRGSGSYTTANVIFGALQIPVEATYFDQALAVEKLKHGDIAAMVFVVGKPAPGFIDLSAADGIHFVPVPALPDLAGVYRPARLRHADYPALVEGDDVETVAVSGVMVAYAWPRSSARYARVERFVNAFFDGAARVETPPRHPKWHEINFADQIPGWTRFPAAEAWLRRAAQKPSDNTLREQFDVFLDTVRPGGIEVSPADRETLLAEYKQWRDGGSTGLSGSSEPPGQARKKHASASAHRPHTSAASRE
jgi:uncharacterized protein